MSIKSNPENIESKYNYELVMKKIKEQEIQSSLKV